MMASNGGSMEIWFRKLKESPFPWVIGCAIIFTANAAGLFRNVAELQNAEVADRRDIQQNQKDIRDFISTQQQINSNSAIQTATLAANQVSFNRRLELVEERERSK